MSTASPSSHSVCFDCETASLDAAYLDMIAPDFKPDARLKDPDKIIANLAEQKQKWIESAALDPRTGRILVIGLYDLNGEFSAIDGDGDEKKLLMEWNRTVALYENETFISFNGNLFDIPFIIRRQWHHGIKPFLRPGVNLRRLDNWIDLRDVWQIGDRQAGGSLDSIAKFFGIGSKSGNGKDFSKLWESDRTAALAYLQNDLALTRTIADRMGVLA